MGRRVKLVYGENRVSAGWIDYCVLRHMNGVKRAA